MSTKYYPLSDLERFEVVMALFPDKLDDEEHDLGDEEEIIEDEFNILPEDFDRLVGRLVMLAPALEAPVSKKIYHVLGKSTGGGGFCSAVKREVRS